MYGWQTCEVIFIPEDIPSTGLMGLSGNSSKYDWLKKIEVINLAKLISILIFIAVSKLVQTTICQLL